MSIPESCIEAATVRAELNKNGWTNDTDEARARRVILALAESLPDSAVEKAWLAYCKAPKTQSAETWKAAMRAAIVAALKDVAGETL